ncbi:MAG: YbjN domain-containing protein [Cellulomonadaceae bacterium]
MTARALLRVVGDRVRRLSERVRRGPGTPGTQPPPSAVSRERVAAYLASRGDAVRCDKDGDLTGLWNGCRFWFLLLGPRQEILQVRGRWRLALPRATHLGALRAINDWNRDRIWPKVYLRDEGPGLVLYAETSFDLEAGVTDAQLATYVSCGLASGVLVFDAMTENYGPRPTDGAEPGD